MTTDFSFLRVLVYGTVSSIIIIYYYYYYYYYYFLLLFFISVWWVLYFLFLIIFLVLNSSVNVCVISVNVVGTLPLFFLSNLMQQNDNLSFETGIYLTFNHPYIFILLIIIIIAFFLSNHSFFFLFFFFLWLCNLFL